MTDKEDSLSVLKFSGMKLIYKIAKDNIFRLLFILLGTVVVSSICLLSFVDLEMISDVYISFSRLVSSDSVVVNYYEAATFSDKEKLDSLTDEIKAIPGVNSLIPFCPKSVYLHDDLDSEILCQIYDSEININFCFNIVEGRLPVKGTNEVLIFNGVKTNYGIGDTIRAKIIDFEKDEVTRVTEDYCAQVELKVVGILNGNSRFIALDSGASNPIELMQEKVSQYSSMYDNPPLMVFSYGCKDTNGNLIQHNYAQNIVYTSVVSLKDGYSVSEVMNSIDEKVSGFGTVKTAGELIEQDVNMKWEEYRPIIGICLVAIFIMAITLVALYLFQIKRGMKALISYYLCGCTWNKILCSICIVNVPTTILGFCIGIVVFEQYTSPFDYMVLTPNAILLTLVLIILIQIIIALVFFFSLYRVSPVDIRRRENE